MAETDDEFVKRMRPFVETWRPIGSGPDVDRLFALARRGAAMNDAVKCQKELEQQDRRYNVAERLFGDDH
mgnify:CR=1 FL=1